ncbi:MAG TPA: delta-60 repeat domain-containing protein, partial [Pirellulales bacterium]|nr:delta-60 repeat domain-containing protein [Pirellulales bacterium]
MKVKISGAISRRDRHQNVFRVSVCLERLENRTVLSSGALDPNFGSDGHVLTDFPGPTNCAAYALAPTPDGKLIAAGTSAGNFAVLRYDANGSVDPTFGSGGQVITTISGSGQARAVTLQSDGKIVAAGFSADNFALVRYLADGSLDPSFGSGGEVTTDFGANDNAFGVVEQPDGKILAAGTSGGSLALSRYLANGSLDPSFGNDGKVSGVNGLGTVYTVALQSDGKIITGGSSGELARFLTNGSLDTGFGNGGSVNTNLGSNETINALTVLPNDEIIVAAQAGENFALAQYQPDGSVDTSFGSGGVVTTNFGGYDGANALAVVNGAIVAAGFSNAVSPSNYTYNFAVARYRMDGSADTSFGNDGKVISD